MSTTLGRTTDICKLFFVLRLSLMPCVVVLLSAATLRCLQDQPNEREKTPEKVVDLFR